MKIQLLTSSLGSYAIKLRNRVSLTFAANLNQEEIGTLANDYLAFKLLTKLPGKNTTFIDVGAHIGSVLSEVHKNDTSIKIIAIEAIPDKAKSISKYFPYAELYCCAAGESRGQVSFYIDTKLSGYSSLLRPPEHKNDRTKEITIPMMKLDDIIKDTNIAMIKIDVEGAELGVLRGSLNILDKCRPTIMFESSLGSIDNNLLDKPEIFDFFCAIGYELFVPNRLAHDGPSLTKEGFLESHWYPRRCTNYFAVPNEKRTYVRDSARNVLNIQSSANNIHV